MLPFDLFSNAATSSTGIPCSGKVAVREYRRLLSP
jgi:hypothetical protein